MPKRTGKPNGPIAPWKEKRQALRRAQAEERQRIYDSLPLSEKLKRAGAKEKAKLADNK